MVPLIFITLWKIFTYVCGVGAWRQKKRHSGRKHGQKVEEAVESRACEGWENTLETASVLRPPNFPLQRGESVTLLMELNMYLGQEWRSQRKLWQVLGSLQEQLLSHVNKVSQGISDTRRVQLHLVPCNDLPGPACLCLSNLAHNDPSGSHKPTTMQGREF